MCIMDFEKRRVNSIGEFYRPSLTFDGTLDPDKVPENLGPHLRTKYFDTRITTEQQIWLEAMDICTVNKIFTCIELKNNMK